MKYTYNINQTSNGTCDLSKLLSEINIAGIQDLNFSDSTIEINFENELSVEDKASLDSVVASHNDTIPAHDSVQIAIANAIDFGKELMTDYATDNVLAGYSTAQVKAISNHLESVQRYIASGSLYVALDEIQSTTPLIFEGTEIISQAKIDSFAQKIMDYLGI